jgi:hypothetical protein
MKTNCRGGRLASASRHSSGRGSPDASGSRRKLCPGKARRISSFAASRSTVACFEAQTVIAPIRPSLCNW